MKSFYEMVVARARFTGAMLFVFGISSALLVACVALQSVTPADRAAGYAREAQTVQVLCKAYKFDRAAGLVGEVPSMTELCTPVQP